MNLLLWYWGKRGGGAKYTLELAKTFQELPEVNLSLSLSTQNELFKQFDVLDTPHCNIDTFTSALGAITNLRHIVKYRKKFKRFLREQKIDLVMCSMAHVWNIFFVDILRELKISYILVMHDAKAHLGETSLIRNWLEKHEIKRTNSLVALSNSVKEEIIKRFDYPQEKIKVLPLGVFDYSQGYRIKPRKLDTSKPIKLLFFGRIVRYKGLDLLLDACLLLQQQQFAFELYIIGEGDLKPYRAAINTLGKNVMVDNRWIPDDEIYDIFYDKDLLILPYIEASQSGLVSIAMSLGIPMVATKVGGLSEQLGKSQFGIILDTVSPKNIVEAIFTLYENPELYERISNNLLNSSKDTDPKTANINTLKQIISL